MESEEPLSEVTSSGITIVPSGPMRLTIMFIAPERECIWIHPEVAGLRFAISDGPFPVDIRIPEFDEQNLNGIDPYTSSVRDGESITALGLVVLEASVEMPRNAEPMGFRYQCSLCASAR